MLKWILLLSSTLLQLTAAGLLPTGHNVGTHEHKEVGLQPPHTFSASVGSHGTKTSGAEPSGLKLHSSHSSAEATPAEANVRAGGNSGANAYGAMISAPSVDIDIRGGIGGVEGTFFKEHNVPTDNPKTKCCGQEEKTSHEKTETEMHTSGDKVGNDHSSLRGNIALTPTVGLRAHDITIEPIPLQYHSYQSGHNTFSSGTPGGAVASNFQFTGGSSQFTHSGESNIGDGVPFSSHNQNQHQSTLSLGPATHESSLSGSSPNTHGHQQAFFSQQTLPGQFMTGGDASFSGFNHNQQQSTFSLNSANHQSSLLGGSHDTHGHQQTFSLDSVNSPFSGVSQNTHGHQQIFSIDSANRESSSLGDSQNIQGHQQTFSFDTGNHHSSALGGSHNAHGRQQFSLNAGIPERSFLGRSQNTHGSIMTSSVNEHDGKQVNADVKMTQISHQANVGDSHANHFTQQIHAEQNSDALDNTKLIDGIFSEIGIQREIVPSIGTEIHIGGHNGGHQIPISPVTHTQQSHITQTDFRVHPNPNLHAQSQYQGNLVGQINGALPSFNGNIAQHQFSSFRDNHNAHPQGNNYYREYNRNIMRQHSDDTFEGY
ncbi:uncharacterized protein LOC124174024 [Ischnura elegans]|uniref:uncharacterized protein LOC124174024 n=1 Tax=Ischnura elegans TaxID=197161 RepID=UPI001ED8A8A7|nr:uncharacterized protein LOC124174024 [Ischnura elegans]